MAPPPDLKCPVQQVAQAVLNQGSPPGLVWNFVPRALAQNLKHGAIARNNAWTLFIAYWLCESPGPARV